MFKNTNSQNEKTQTFWIPASAGMTHALRITIFPIHFIRFTHSVAATGWPKFKIPKYKITNVAKALSDHGYYEG